MFMSVQKVFCFKHLLMFLVLLCFSINISSQFTSGHFFGTTKNIGNYQIVFAPYPPLPFAGDNSTLLNFSILDKENQNVNNIFASLLIKIRKMLQLLRIFHSSSMSLVILLSHILLRRLEITKFLYWLG